MRAIIRIILTGVSLPDEYSLSAPVIRSLVPVFVTKKNWYEIQLIDELVLGSFEPPDARTICTACQHLQTFCVWKLFVAGMVSQDAQLSSKKKRRSVKRNMPPG